jgi:hypothetical protein
MTIYVRKHDSTQLVWTSFLTPFSVGGWLCLIASLLWLSTVLLQHERTVVRDSRSLAAILHSHVLSRHTERLSAKRGFRAPPKLALCNLLFTQFRNNGACINLFKPKTSFMYHQLQHSETLRSVHNAFVFCMDLITLVPVATRSKT